MSCGANDADLYRRACDFVDKILRGAKPGDIPVELPTKFDLIINLTTAKTLGLEVPPTLLARAECSSGALPDVSSPARSSHGIHFPWTAANACSARTRPWHAEWLD